MKKITRKEKEKLTKEGVCWKCGKRAVEYIGGVILCKNCGLKIVRY